MRQFQGLLTSWNLEAPRNWELSFKYRASRFSQKSELPPNSLKTAKNNFSSSQTSNSCLNKPEGGVLTCDLTPSHETVPKEIDKLESSQ
jgi:hypothetical protein